MQTPEDEKLYAENDVAPPLHIPHGGSIEELQEQYKVQAHHSWKQQGNQLVCDCELGYHVSFIPTTHMLQGTDDEGLPVLKKIQL